MDLTEFCNIVRVPLAARSFVLDLLSTLRGGAMPVAALLAAGALFGLSEGSLRVAVARLTASGHLERDERGAYRLGARVGPMARHVGAWRRTEERTHAWNGSWLAATAVAGGPRDRAGARRGRRALALFGLRELEPGLWLRPDNLRGGIEAARRGLVALGLAVRTPVFTLRDLDDLHERRARRLWPCAALRRGYAATVARLEASARRLERLPDGAAMVESFHVGGEAIRCITSDPLLPEPLVPAAERRRLIDAMRRYDRLGRQRWAGLLGRYGLPAAAAPASGAAAEAIGAPVVAVG